MERSHAFHVFHRASLPRSIGRRDYQEPELFRSSQPSLRSRSGRAPLQRVHRRKLLRRGSGIRRRNAQRTSRHAFLYGRRDERRGRNPCAYHEESSHRAAGNPLPTLKNPLRMAEELAEIDLISHGRLVPGWVRGAGSEQLFNNANPAYNREYFNEAHDVVSAAWTRPGPFRWEGKHFNYRFINPWALPYQK